MKLLRQDGIWFAARILVGFLLAYAGWSKLTEPAENFEAALLRYGVFSPLWIPWIARILPWFEWILGGFLIVGYAPRLAAGAASFLFLVFLVTLGSSHLFLESGSSDCGCFGARGILHLSVRQIFVVDLTSFVLTLRLAFLETFPGSLHSFLLKGQSAADDIKGTRRRQ